MFYHHKKSILKSEVFAIFRLKNLKEKGEMIRSRVSSGNSEWPSLESQALSNLITLICIYLIMWTCWVLSNIISYLVVALVVTSFEHSRNSPNLGVRYMATRIKENTTCFWTAAVVWNLRGAGSWIGTPIFRSFGTTLYRLKHAELWIPEIWLKTRH